MGVANSLHKYTSDMENNIETIDLTQQYIYQRAPILLSESVIELDDSIGPVASPEAGTGSINTLPGVSLESQSKKPTATKKKKRSSTTVCASTPNEKIPRLGDCPICRDPLGNRPMASTKCGHVYCTVCVEQAARIEKRCPTCRKPLKGPNAFHPLFL